MTKAAKELGDREAMFQLAEAHEAAFSETASAQQAFYWANEMAKANAPAGMVRVARAYKEGAIVARDPAKFLEWAKKAERSAQIEKSKKINPDWANEDLPRALSTLAEAYEANDQKPKANDADRRAAIAAKAAIRRSFEYGKKVSEDLPEIIFKRLASFKNQNGKVNSRRKTAYAKLLIDVAEAVEQTFPNQGSSCPPALVAVLYELALAYKRGEGVTKNSGKYLYWLERSAAKRHAEAMYRLALRHKRDGDDNEYASGIENAAEVGHAQAFVAISLDKCQLSKTLRARISPLLKKLSDVVYSVRENKHAVIDDGRVGVAHYTDRKAIESMLSASPKEKTNVLRLYNIAYFNDPDEGKRLVEFKVNEQEEQNPLRNFITPNNDPNKLVPWLDQSFHVYVCSFALVADRLDLWRAYGKDGYGYCIVTPLSVFRGDAGKPIMGGSWGDEAGLSTATPLYKVLYTDEDVKFALKRLAPALNAIDKAIPKKHPARASINAIVRTTVSELLYLYKGTEYASEREARIVMALKLSAQRLKRDARETSVRLYTETVPMLFNSPGSRIIIGPKVQDVASAIVDLEHNLACQGWSDNCAVEYSTIHYK